MNRPLGTRVELPVAVSPVAGSATQNPLEAERSLLDAIPSSLVLIMASPYLAGRTAGEAVNLAHRLYRDDRFTSTIDILGEDARSEQFCQEAVDSYRNLIDRICESPLPCPDAREQMTVSLKPSMFSTEKPAGGAHCRAALERAYERIKGLVAYAHKRQIRVTIEAEDHNWTDFQLETYFSLLQEGFSQTGTVLQSRLFRSRNDIKRFDQTTRVRLVIGIYNEPAEIAHTAKPAMKAVLVELACELAARGAYIEIATHDLKCLESFFQKAVIPQAVPPTRFETQFLMGVPRRGVQKALTCGSYFAGWEKRLPAADREHKEALAASGVLVRLYLPFGSAEVAGPYCKRRLKANPDMIGFGIKNLLKIR